MKYSIPLSLGERLIIFRRRSGLSRQQLAGMVKVSPTTISNYENGVCTPSTKMLTLITEALGISVDMLLFEQNGKELEDESAPEPTVQNQQQNKS